MAGGDGRWGHGDGELQDFQAGGGVHHAYVYDVVAGERAILFHERLLERPAEVVVDELDAGHLFVDPVERVHERELVGAAGAVAQVWVHEDARAADVGRGGGCPGAASQFCFLSWSLS